jgi:hypothetical protein
MSLDNLFHDADCELLDTAHTYTAAEANYGRIIWLSRSTVAVEKVRHATKQFLLSDLVGRGKVELDWLGLSSRIHNDQ